jgi:hypothetical protein
MQGTSTAGTAPTSISSSAPPGVLRRSFRHWREVAHAIGVVQTRFLMFGFYLMMVVPTGGLMRIFRDPLHLRRLQGSNWSPIQSDPPSLENARRQF